ncbi:MAG: serine hydrolase domain-containing protein [Ferruginibacter sp.]
MNSLSKSLIHYCSVVVILLLGNSNSCYGQEEQLTQKIDNYLQSKFEKGNIPGFTVAVVKKDKILLSKGYGKSSNHQDLTANTPFAIASLSKAFTALAIMQLVESGKIILDVPISMYYPSFPLLTSKITVRKLLNQTSGLSDKFFPEMQYNQQPQDLDASIERLRGRKFDIEPVEKFHYHNPNYQILARIVELVSKQSFSEYLRENICEPLGMKYTKNISLTNYFYTSNGGNLAEGYNFIFGISRKMKELNWFVEGSAGMTSTADDMAKWLMLFLNKGKSNGASLLNAENIQLMLTPSKKSGSSYGMGWSINDERIATHTGILWTYQSEQMLMLEKGYGVVILFNSGLNAFQDYGSFSQGILEIINGNTPGVGIQLSIYLELLMVLLMIVTFYFGIKSIKEKRKWQNKMVLRLTLNVLLRLFPLIIFILIPQIMIFISGRVLSWERVFWMMPSIIIWLAIQSTFNIIIIFLRLKPIVISKY